MAAYPLSIEPVPARVHRAKEPLKIGHFLTVKFAAIYEHSGIAARGIGP